MLMVYTLLLLDMIYFKSLLLLSLKTHSCWGNHIIGTSTREATLKNMYKKNHMNVQKI